ncbi:hypothetical protein A1O1_02866 [Capronia coronata CBS 617.96]|uniref:Major facilitator superfamily (MFS) profile domain-containing protein n=1 Tax=Capronia coronata CBS 617.96 TaxID=1182541 RepID=W9YXS6_9EURO|nr:uncharacterized protein A1O1_02866 [Capronia coronata CBS 617.96]EXJ94470.1 hypothetical protein A1O1_02866 [Capronia coronata CBS 617.96]
MAEFMEKSVLGDHEPVDKEALVEEGVAREIGPGELEYIPDDPKTERLLTTRMDFKVIPILGLLYLICFLDRTNIANARLAGLEKGLNMPSTGFNTALWIFYIPFVLAEVPSNMMMSLPWIKPNLFLGGQTFILGVLAMCQGLTHSYGGLLGVRFLMGIVETGLPAGAGLLIASYYRKKELSLRFALFFAFGQAGSCFSGLLAYAIQGMDGAAGLAGWRWIFVIEGLVTIFFSIFVFIFTPHFPGKDKWISEHDRARLLARLEADKGKEYSNQKLANNKKVPWTKVVFDYRIWLMTLLFFCSDMSAGSLSSFNPTILSQLGWKARRAQVMTIPVWIAGIVGALASTLASGRLNKRWPFILPAIVVSIIGWTLHVTYQAPGVRYFAQFIISVGTFIQMPLYIGLLTANLRGRAYLSFGTAIQLGLGNCANFVSSNVFITTQAPHYPVGFGTGLGITCLSFPVMLLVIFLFIRHNKKIDRKLASLAPGEVLDDQIDYKYVY